MDFIDRLNRNWQFVSGVFKALRRVTPITRKRNRTIGDAVEDLAAKYGDRLALVSEAEALSYSDLDALANRYARWARANGVGKGDTVCLLMRNRPEFVAIWLGIARAGGITALLNTNLTGKALAHCINLVEPEHAIIDSGLLDRLDHGEADIAGDPVLWQHGPAPGDKPRIDLELERFDDGPLAAEERAQLTLDDGCLYIYTSGTTGFPKAAVVNHFRVYGSMLAFSSFMRATEDDRNYNCLPLYHSSGGILGIGCGLMAGGSVYIAERFSVSRFWDEVVDHDCTRIQYIGELCRYLVTAPPHPKERMHRVTLACGNGLRGDIWEAFQDRFGIREIREFYAATEGNAILFNWDGTPGAVGRIPNWARPIFPVAVVRFDVEREEPIRNDQGLCTECDHGEIGEVISRIVVNALKPSQRFDGYSDRKETERKVLRDVLEAGDMWFRTGDLMYRDRDGYFYFVDRIGDTYRWKGENVSTSEVGEILMQHPGVDEAIVYGVTIPGIEGRAGMVALVPNEDFSLESFHRYMHTHLSSHTRPIFLRLRQTLTVTTTFKQRRIELVREGYDPSRSNDAVYLDDPEDNRWVRMTETLFTAVNDGQIRL